MTIRLQRLHLSSSHPSATLAINWPHSQRVSPFWQRSESGAFVMAIRVIFFAGEIENDY